MHMGFKNHQQLGENYSKSNHLWDIPPDNNFVHLAFPRLRIIASSVAGCCVVLFEADTCIPVNFCSSPMMVLWCLLLVSAHKQTDQSLFLSPVLRIVFSKQTAMMSSTLYRLISLDLFWVAVRPAWSPHHPYHWSRCLLPRYWQVCLQSRSRRDVESAWGVPLSPQILILSFCGSGMEYRCPKPHRA